MTNCVDPIIGKSRPIQGLRALAVIAVFLFHLNPEWLPGGYLGVDVFFVISGFLIARMLRNDISESGRIRFRRFYLRRFSRIGPAALIVAIAAFPMAYFALLPGDMRDFSASMVGVITLTLNKMVANNIGYFSPIAETQPLLHYWSLMVEMHFYLLAPLIFYVFRGPKKLIFVCASLALISLFYAHWLSSWDPKNNYYLLPSRLWEFLVGICLYLGICIHSQSELIRRIAIGVQYPALIALMSYLWAFDSSMRHPSLYSLALVIVTATVIWSAVIQSEGWIAKLLSHRILVLLGNMSFSIYLWHYVFIVVYKADTGILSGGDMIQVVVLTMVCATITYFAVEQSFVSNNGTYKGLMIQRSVVALCILAMLSLGILGFSKNGFERSWLLRQSEEVGTAYLLKEQASDFRRFDQSTDCMFRVESIDDQMIESIDKCKNQYGRGTLIVGDSHAIGVWRLARRIVDTSTNRLPFVVGISRGGCKPYQQAPGCSLSVLSDKAEYFGANFARVFYAQAGSSLLGGISPNTAHIGAVVEFLKTLSPFVETMWLGPRLEPNIDPRRFVRAGCDVVQTFDPDHHFAMRELDNFLISHVEDQDIRYISSRQFDLSSFGSCRSLLWRDSNHWSPAGIDSLSMRPELAALIFEARVSQ